MSAILFLQGSLGALNSRDCSPLFLDAVGDRPLLGLLLDEAVASHCFERVIFVTSAERCDDSLAQYLASDWPAIEVLRLTSDLPHAFNRRIRRNELLESMDYAGLLSVDGFKAVAPEFVCDPVQTVFVLDVNDAPLCSRSYFQKALPLAKETGFYRVILPGSAALCGFSMRVFEGMVAHQRSLRVGESATVRERVDRAMQEARREKYLDPHALDQVHDWQRQRADRYGLFMGGSLAHTVRDWVARHSEGPARGNFVRETQGEAIAIVTQTALEMVRIVLDMPERTNLEAIETWLSQYEQRIQLRQAQAQFYPDYPAYLEIELTSRCNVACRFCPQTKLTRAKEDLDYDAFKSLLDRVSDFVTLLNLSGFGEPTLHPRLFDCVRYAKSKGIPRVGLETNGMRIDEAFLDEVFQSGLDILTINLDALDGVDQVPFGSVYELIRRFRQCRGESDHPFIVLQRVNMSVPGQDAKVQRDFTLWCDAADAFVIKPFNTYRATFDDKRPIDFAPLDRSACRKILASSLVLSSGQPMLCEQCFDGQQLSSDEMLGPSGEYVYTQRLRINQNHGRVNASCKPCTQWYQADMSWTMPHANRVWFEQALAGQAQNMARAVLEYHGQAIERTTIPEIVRRSDDLSDELRTAFEQTMSADRWIEALACNRPVSAGTMNPQCLKRPTACLGIEDRLYVTEAAGKKIVVLSLNGECERTFGSFDASAANTDLPDLAVLNEGDSRRTLCVASNDRIERFSLTGDPLGSLIPEGCPAIAGIAAGNPGTLWVATREGRLLLIEVASGQVLQVLSDASWLSLLIGSSPETNELFVSSIDRDEVFLFDLAGTPKARIGRSQIGRLDKPFSIVRCGERGYAISNHGAEEVLFLSPALEYWAAFRVGTRPRRITYAGGRLLVIGSNLPGCLVWEFADERSTVSA